MSTSSINDRPVRGLVSRRNQRRATHRSTPLTKLTVIILASSLFATFVSPQLYLAGRGLRTSLPIFALYLGVTFILQPANFFLTFRRHARSMLFGGVFVAVGLLRYIFDPHAEYFSRFVVGSAIGVALWISIILLRELYPESVEGTRWIILVTLGVSLGMGIPLLLRQPGIARLTMGNIDEGYYANILYANGVANYSWYTPVAIALPVIANWLYKCSTPATLIGWGLLLATAGAVMLSTFTMAAVLLLIGVLAWLLSIVLSRERGRLPATFILLLLSILIPSLYGVGMKIGGIAFIVQKVALLADSISTDGILVGDVTGRTSMFWGTMKTFFQNPIFGAWGLRDSFFYGGHSSWADTLAVHGLPVFLLWLAFLASAWKRRPQPFSSVRGNAGGTISWILLGVGGILNNTLSSQMGLILLWLYDEAEFWQVKTEPVGPRQTKNDYYR